MQQQTHSCSKTPCSSRLIHAARPHAAADSFMQQDPMQQQTHPCSETPCSGRLIHAARPHAAADSSPPQPYALAHAHNGRHTFTSVLRCLHVNERVHTLWHMPSQAREKRDALGSIQSGASRLVVSTHSALFTSDWKKLGLVVIDEQHKCARVCMCVCACAGAHGRVRAVVLLCHLRVTACTTTGACLGMHGHAYVHSVRAWECMAMRTCTLCVPGNAWPCVRALCACMDTRCSVCAVHKQCCRRRAHPGA